MKPHYQRFCFIILIPVLLCLSQGSPAYGQHDQPLLRIGAIVSLTGSAGEQGKNWLEGAQLAVDQLAKRNISIDLIVEDDATNPRQVVTAFHKLAVANKVEGIIGGTWDFLAEAAFPLARQYRIPFVTPTNPVEILSESAKSNPWIFTNGLSLKAEGEAIRGFIRRYKVKSISLIYINVPFGTSHADLVRKIAVEESVEIHSDSQLTYQGFVETIRQAALRVHRTKPDLVYCVSDYSGIDLLTREFDRLRMNPLLLTTQHLDQALIFSRDPGRYTRAYGIYPAYKRVNFEKSFLSKFGHKPKVYAAAGYDALMFMGNALEQGVPFGEKAAEYSYYGITGEHRLPAKSRALAESRAVVMTTKNGVFERDEISSSVP